MNAAAESQIETYQRSLRECLANLSIAEREDIIREISVHIRESAGAESNVSVILDRLGNPAELAAQYTDNVIIRRATRSISPITILRATLHLARRGVEGTVLFFFALFGYAVGIGLVITALLKSFFPRETGLWVGPHTFDFGFRTPAQTAAHEIAGWLYIPAALLIGGFFLWFTTYGMRWLIARMGLRKAPISRVASQSHAVLSM